MKFERSEMYEKVEEVEFVNYWEMSEWLLK